MAVVTQIQVRRGTAAQWTSTNPTLSSGEFGYETDTGKIKIGDGATAWTSLGYTGSGTVTSITAGTGLSGGAITTSGTIAIDSTVATLTGTQTLTNKTLTAPILGTPASVTLTNGTGLPVSGITASTSAALGVGSIELGAVSDTTIARVSAGVVSIEGVNVVTTSSTDTLTNKTLTAPIVNLTLNAQTGTTYTFVLTDNGKLVTASNASAQTYTIPPNASVAYATGAQINVIAIGAGQVSFAAGAGVTIASTGATSTAPKLRVQYSSATLMKVATDTWYVIGDIS